MSLKINGKTTEDTLSDKFEKDGKLLGDVAQLFTFAATVTSGGPLSFAAGAALILKTAGSAISACTNIIKRLSETEKNSPLEDLESYDRFRVLFYVTCQRLFLESLSKSITDHERKKRPQSKTEKLKERELKDITSQLKVQVANIYECELTFLYGFEPLSGDVPLYDAFAQWTATALTFHGYELSEAREIATESEKSARKRFHVFLSGKEATAQWMRNYLALARQSEATAKVVSDLATIKDTLRNWTDPIGTLKQSQTKAWNAYRQTLRSLPDLKETMFNESFGVREVFVQPRVSYHVRGAQGDAGKPQAVSDLGRLIGALVSSRIGGEDLIILCGGPGSGKSTFCRLASSELASDPNLHPIFLRLRRVKEGAEIGQFIEESLQKQGLINRISDLRDIPNLVFVLDGFDELVMASRARLRHFFNVLREDLSSGPLRDAKAIVSGRDTLFPKGEGLPLGSHVLSLQAFDKAQVKSWGAKWRHLHKSGNGGTFHPEEFVENDKSDQRKSPLHHLVSWPLTLHLVARVHTAGKLEVTGKAGKRVEKAYLYRSILSETSSRQSEQTEGSGRLEERKMREFLRTLGWEMHSRSTDSMDPAEVIPILKQYYPEKNELDLAELAEVAVVNCPELTKGEETGFEFVHKSFAEYLVGERIAELVERVAFKAPDFGKELTWRMSEQEAARELSPVLANRLVPEEVQEMFEPMLGCFGPFSKGEKVDEAVAVPARKEGLNRILSRFEILYSTFLKGDAFDTISKIVPVSTLVRTPLEAHANYFAGLLIIGTGAARQLGLYRGKGEKSNLFNGEPFRGAFWRGLCILAAGGLPVDDTLSDRVFRGMRVKAEDESARVSDLNFPIKLGKAARAEGFEDTIGSALEEYLNYATELEAQVFLLSLLVRNSPHPLFRKRGPNIIHSSWMGHFDPRVREPSPDRKLIALLMEGGFVGDRIDRVLRETDKRRRETMLMVERALGAASHKNRDRVVAELLERLLMQLDANARRFGYFGEGRFFTPDLFRERMELF
ncbi:MAG TPA: NACHT domain-containing protein [Verrucomicrobiales bacterium]|nr:NACHT domain-containing protein [Verrucomicrobiales bacterium]